jgi:hypothetical protein
VTILRRTCSGGGSSSRRSSSITLSSGRCGSRTNAYRQELGCSLIHFQEDDTLTSDAYNSFGSFARPESSSIQSQVLPQQQDSVFSVRGHTPKDYNSGLIKIPMTEKARERLLQANEYCARVKLFNVDCLQSWHVLHHSIAF